MSAIALAPNLVLDARTKHIELDVHFVRDQVLAKQVELRHVPPADQIADIFTKPLDRQSLVKLRDKLGVVSLSSLGLRRGVRDQLKELKEKPMDQVKDQVKESCNGTLHGIQHVADHVTANGARDLIKAGCAEVETIQELVATRAAGLKDHKRTYKDVLAQGRLKHI